MSDALDALNNIVDDFIKQIMEDVLDNSPMNFDNESEVIVFLNFALDYHLKVKEYD